MQSCERESLSCRGGGEANVSFVCKVFCRRDFVFMGRSKYNPLLLT